MSVPSSGVSAAGPSYYSAEVSKRLRGLPSDQRREVADDVHRRLVDMGIGSWDEAVQRLGPPAEYAAELREAAGWPRARRRWPWVLLAIVALAAVVAGGVAWQRGDSVPEDYPLLFVSRMQSGAGSSAGSVVVMPERVDEPITVAVELRNQGDRTVRLDGLQRFVGASTQNGLVVMGSDADPPLWAPDSRVFRQAEPDSITLTEFDDPSGFVLAGFTVAPGETVVLQLRGPVMYCVATEQGTAIGDHIRLDVTIGGERRVITGTELSFPLGNCS